MFDVRTLRQLYRHMEWADATVWRVALGRDEPLDDRVRYLLLHIHIVQRAFLHVWTQQPIRAVFRKPEEFATLGDLRTWARPYYREVESFLDTVQDAQLPETVVLPWSKQLAEQLGRDPEASTLADTMFQVTSHSTYHRGQVNIRLREIGAEPPLVDYIAWIWNGRPAADWKD